MKLTALITTIVLGTTSIVAAKPAQREAPAQTPGAWFALSDPMKLSRGHDEIKLSTVNTFSTLRLQAAAGSNSVRSISVFYAEGGVRVIELGATLEAGKPMVEVSLEGARRIAKVAIVGTSERGGTVQLFGM